jgi:hypothetical protein
MSAVSRDFKATAEAYQKFGQVLGELEVCKRLFELAGEPLPAQLREFFGGDRSNGKNPQSSVSIPPPHRSNRPMEATENWISIALNDAMATNLVLAVLRKTNGPVRAKDVVEMVTRLNPQVTRGAINNIGTRLSGGLIERTDDGWTLSDRTKAGVITDGYFWGPVEIFEKQELAAHRREAILYILKNYFRGGLQVVQFVEILRGLNWMKAPASKDLLKADMEILQSEGIVRRVGNSKKWEAVEID